MKRVPDLLMPKSVDGVGLRDGGKETALRTIYSQSSFDTCEIPLNEFAAGKKQTA